MLINKEKIIDKALKEIEKEILAMVQTVAATT